MELNKQPRLKENNKITKSTTAFLVDAIKKKFYNVEPEFDLLKILERPEQPLETPVATPVMDFVPLSAAAAQTITSATSQPRNYYFERFVRDMESAEEEERRLQKLMRNRSRNLITGY